MNKILSSKILLIKRMDPMVAGETFSTLHDPQEFQDLEAPCLDFFGSVKVREC